MKYSLSDYHMNVKTNDPALNSIFGEISIGGEGSAIDSIEVAIDGNLWDTTGFATGGYVQDKNLSRVGTATISLSQLSKYVNKFKQLCNAYYGGDYDGLTITITDADNNEVAKCEDAMIQKIPTQAFGSKAAMQTWTFTCGKITLN